MSDDLAMARNVVAEGVRRDVGLALRAHRRELAQSQRGYARRRGLSRDVLARAEVDAGRLSLEVVTCLLKSTGFELAVVPVGRSPHVDWDRTDLAARTRSGSRFPAHRQVRESVRGPVWWHYHEVLGNREFGMQPTWTAEGFIPPEGTRYGKQPRPYGEGEGPRWPY